MADMDMETQYSNAPIMEAILDIQVEASKDVSLTSLANCQNTLYAEYPTKRVIKTPITHLETGPQVAGATGTQDLGFAFISNDGKQLFQVRPNGFTVNRLAPYSGWKNFSHEAVRLWNIYRGEAKPGQITRIALRFINRIDIPTSQVELKDYFHTLPEIARGLPQSMAGFFMQILLPLEDVKAFVNIVETIVDPPQPGMVSVLLDLDLFRNTNLPDSEEGIWSLFEGLRVKKNAVFDSCITEKTKELIR